MRAARALAVPVEPVSSHQARAAVPAVGERGLSVAAYGAGEVPSSLWAEWRALADLAAEVNCFAEPWFVAAGLRNLASDADVRLIEVRGAAGLVGLLPVCVARGYGRLSVRHVENWQHFHDFLGTPLVRAGHERAFWSAILGHLDDASWASGFLHVKNLVEGGPVHSALAAAAADRGRACPVVHLALRAELASRLSPRDYYEAHVRKKKRKELKRLSNRLAELGAVSCSRLGHDEAVEPWCDAFLALERSGWKGRAGSALACAPPTERFFREAVAGAWAADRLGMLRLDLDGRPIAMLVNFIAPPGSFSFKIAFDEAYARFSPGVLIQLENLDILARGDIEWMDSCAAENHPMIDSLWVERRSIVRVTVRLGGLRRGLTYGLCRALEAASAARRSLLQRRAPTLEQEETA